MFDKEIHIFKIMIYKLLMENGQIIQKVEEKKYMLKHRQIICNEIN